MNSQSKIMVDISADWNKIIEDEISFTFKIKTTDLKWDENIAFQYIKELKDEVDSEYSALEKNDQTQMRKYPVAVRAFPSLLVDDYWEVVDMMEYILKKRAGTLELKDDEIDEDEDFNITFMSDQITNNLAFWLKSILSNLPVVNSEIRAQCKQLFFRSVKKIEIYEELLRVTDHNDKSAVVKSILAFKTDGSSPNTNEESKQQFVHTLTKSNSVKNGELLRETIVIPERESTVRMSVLSAESPLANKLHHHAGQNNLLRASLLSGTNNQNQNQHFFPANQSDTHSVASVQSGNGQPITRERSNSLTSDTSIGSGRSFSHFRALEVNETTISQFVKMLLSRGIRCQFLLPTRSSVATPCDCLIYFPENTPMSIAASTDSGDSNGNNIFCVKIVTKGKRQVEPLRIEISTILRAVKGKGQNTNIPGSLHEDFLFTIELKDKPEMCFCMDSMLRRDIAVLAFPRALIAKRAARSNGVVIDRALSQSSDKSHTSHTRRESDGHTQNGVISGNNSVDYSTYEHDYFNQKSPNTSASTTPNLLRGFFTKSTSASSNHYVGIASASMDNQTTRASITKPVSYDQSQPVVPTADTTRTKRKSLNSTLKSAMKAGIHLTSYYWVQVTTGQEVSEQQSRNSPAVGSHRPIHLLITTSDQKILMYQVNGGKANSHLYGEKLVLSPEPAAHSNNTAYSNRQQLSGLLENMMDMPLPTKFLEEKQFVIAHEVNASGIQSIEDCSPSNEENIIRINLLNKKFKIYLQDYERRQRFISQLSKMKRLASKTDD